MDLRVQKTERALVEALLKLLEEKPFDQITVSDLCDTAMVRRATFYKHFKDKYEFLDFCIDKRQRHFDMLCKKKVSHDSMELYLSIVRDMLRYLRENKALLDHTVKRTEASALADVFAKQLTHDIEQRMAAMEQADFGLTVPPEIIAAFFSGALFGVARWWHYEAPDMTEDELLDHIRSLLSSCTPINLKHYEEGNHERKPAEK